MGQFKTLAYGPRQSKGPPGLYPIAPLENWKRSRAMNFCMACVWLEGGELFLVLVDRSHGAVHCRTNGAKLLLHAFAQSWGESGIPNVRDEAASLRPFLVKLLLGGSFSEVTRPV